jgi:UDP-perosamine 4-acetyltransferase
MNKALILGCGGHSKVLVDTIDRIKEKDFEVVAFLDNDRNKCGKSFGSIPVMGGDDLISGMILDGVTHFIVGVGGIGDCSLRAKVFEKGLSSGLKPLTVIDPSATISKSARIEEGAQILVGAIINANAQIGRNTIINSGAIVEHDCIIGESVHIAPGVTISGNVKIGDLSHIGTGASIIQGVEIGMMVIVGSGSVVIRDISDKSVVVGNPAKEIRKRN